MQSRRHRIRQSLLLALLVTCSCCAGLDSVLAQPGNSRQSDAERIEQANWNRGYHGLALVCRSLGMQVHEDESAWAAQPGNERIVIILGESLPRFSASRVVDLGGAALVAFEGDARIKMDGRSFQISNRISVAPSSPAYGYQGLYDCPIISKFPFRHPSTAGVKQIVTNCPATFRNPRVSGRFQTLGLFPRTWQGDEYEFAIGTKAESNKRFLLCSDPSVFTNQMITLGDNAKFTVNTLKWLQGASSNKRSHVLLIVDGRSVAPPFPDRLDVDIPPPTPDEVLEALKHLPKDKLLEVGNHLAELVQEENLPNELLAEVAKDVKPVLYQRALVFLATALLGLFLLFRYLKSESLLQDALGIGDNPDKERRVEAKYRQAGERRAVAVELVNRFYGELTGGQFDHDAYFPEGLTVNAEYSQILKEMKQTGKNLRSKKAKWWTPARLQNLCTQLDYWNELRRSEALVIEHSAQ